MTSVVLVLPSYGTISSAVVALYGFEILTFWVGTTVIGFAGTPVILSVRLLKVTLNSTGGRSAQSNESLWIGCGFDIISTVSSAASLALDGCHLVEIAPSTAERGNCPDMDDCGDFT